MAGNVLGAMSPGLNNVTKLIPLNTNNNGTDEAQGVGGTSFADYLKGALDNVNNLQTDAQVASDKLATGEIDDIHSVMIAGQKAELSLQFTLAIRNKIMDAYSEIMRMQV